jgi:UDP-N-acetylmuramyl pentapeptide phosphotransferase/UDP-N-acetylglucosamine-1-phosphate transferase
MTGADFLSVLLYAVAVGAVAAMVTRAVLGAGLLLDVPNERSSHTYPIPRSGGLGILAGAVAGTLALQFAGHIAASGNRPLLGLVVGSLVAALAGLADDIRPLPPLVKLLAQAIAAGLAISQGLVIEAFYIPGLGPIALGPLGVVVTALWLVGLTNVVNIMDGLDGLAGGTAALAATFLALAALLIGQPVVALLAVTIAAAGAGFLAYNAPPARIIMGDAGSHFLGFALAGLGVLAARGDASGTLVLIVPLLMFHFIFDAIYTAIRRWRRGERVTAAHRNNLYQRLNQTGLSHQEVTLLHCAMAALQGFAALWYVGARDSRCLPVFGAALLIQVLYTRMVLRRERRQR